MDMLDRVTVEDLKGDQRELAEIIGIETYIKLVRLCGGSDLYIAKPDRLIRDREIRSKFNGYNHAKLAQEYGVTERTIRSIVSPVLQEVRRAPIEGQVTFF